MSTYTCDCNGVRAEVAAFTPEGGTAEAHVMLHVTDGTLPFERQVEALRLAADELLRTRLSGMQVVFGRQFVSDSANQAASLSPSMGMVEQPPLDGTKVAVWLYVQEGGSITTLPDGMTVLQRGAYRHLWTAQGVRHDDTSYGQTCQLLGDYAAALREQGCTLYDNCVRTWFFVQNVDVNYAGLVKARNHVFASEGLASDTHFIASTGIGGRHHDPGVYVTMDTYAIDGLQPGQLKYLYARTHLNPTYEYGVAFERGATVDYADRRHVYISGTASINNRGEVVFPGDIRRQTQRMWDNVEALLAEAGCGWQHVGHMIVYLRDVSDYAVVKQMFDDRFPNTPRVITYARVCRPGWLIEMECMGVKMVKGGRYERF